MSENETKPTETTTPTESSAAVEPTPATKPKSKNKALGILVALVIVALALLFVLYQLEKQGRSSTSIFSALIEQQAAGAVVATVNDESIDQGQLDMSMRQFSQFAAAQGVDLSTPEAQAEMRAQALEVLINTELLKQAADERGLVVTDEEVAERLSTLETELGGAEVLKERMAALGIEAEQLQEDIKEEMLVQALLEEVFAEAEIEVTEQEVREVYENASDDMIVGDPAFEEVAAQVEMQLRAAKEQAAIDEYLAALKSEAEIEVVE